MNNQDKTLNLLGLAMRARQVTLGEEAILKSLKHNHSSLLFLATDSGSNIKKKVYDKAKTYDVPVIEKFTSEELSRAIGKENRKLVLVTEKGFIKRFLEY